VTGLGTPNGKNCTPLNTIPPQSCTQAPSATPGVATDIVVPTPSLPSFITKGRDCAVWFSEVTDGKIGRVAPDGSITEYDIPGWVPQFSLVLGLTAGPDGNIYFAAELNTVQHIIGKLEPATGAVTSIDVTAAAGIINTFQVAAARDGTIWFTTRSNRIGAVNPSLTLVEGFALPNASADTYGITLAPDGNMWFTDATNNQLGRITPLGDVRTFGAPGALGAAPLGIAAGPDSRIWFVEPFGGPTGNGAIGAATLDGTILGEIPLNGLTSPTSIAAGPDGNMWFTEDDGDILKIGRVTTAMPITVSEFNVATQPTDVFRSGNGITAGPDGNVWFTEATVSRIGKITPP
jgi:streptogramin lyase